MRRGKHRVYIGMAAGVGKTYRMLEESHELKEEGIDVVIGLIETHGRQDTIEMIRDLEKVPKKTIAYNGTVLEDMDVEGILNRQPQLVLIDELAHTNIPSVTNKKRYEDVEMVLNAGIDVFSTLNIQHIESLNDLVAKITGVVVRERVPDRILHQADEIVVVDVTPETLIERLQEGKIYAPTKIDQSLQNFFQLRHLIALRELALREVADNVTQEADTRLLEKPEYSIKEQVLVCVSTYPYSVKLLRRGARIAHYLSAGLYVLYVSHPERFLSKDEALYLEMCEDLCQQLGGQFIRHEDTDVTQAIAKIAHQYRITQVVLGHTHKSRWQLLLKGSPVHRLMSYLKAVDLHIVVTEK
ncbi:universal stress protein [Aphanothece hegewaldii]|uniref:universal stress protein n=1 Tax=Aphanothece hegewaldii TaxID=1521625 RepID=UPI001C62BCE2|nr:universal stress protein [Aphanothece hegewaldii]